MSTITHRVGLGRNLTGAEVDANFDSLKADVDSNTTALASKVPTTRSINGHALAADVTVTKGDIGLSSVDNTSDAAKPISTAQAAVNAVKADLVGGVIPVSQLPALAINDTFTVASQAAMLALTAQRGDIAVRTDFTPAKFFILTVDAPGTLGNWIEITTAGATSFAALSDKVTADLPGTNTPLATALAAKSDLLIGEKTVSATTYTVIESDKKKTLTFTSATGCVVTHPVGLSVGHAYKGVVDVGAGNVTLQGDGTSAVVSKTGSLVTNGAKSSFVVEQRSTNVFSAEGDLGALVASDIYAAVLALLTQGSNITLTGNGTTISVSASGGGGGGAYSDFGDGYSGFVRATSYNNNTTTLAGVSSITSTGTLVADTSGVVAGLYARVGFQSAAAANSLAGTRTTSTGIGQCPGTDPLHIPFRFRGTIIPVDALSGCRGYCGIGSVGTPSATAEPSAELNTIMLAHDSGDTQWTVMHNDGSGACTKEVLNSGSGFPVTQPAEITFKVVGGAGANRICTYTVTNMVTGLTATGSFTSDLPIASTAMIPWIFRNTVANTTAATVSTTGLFWGAYAGIA